MTLLFMELSGRVKCANTTDCSIIVCCLFVPFFHLLRGIFVCCVACSRQHCHWAFTVHARRQSPLLRNHTLMCSFAESLVWPWHPGLSRCSQSICVCFVADSSALVT